MLTITVEALLLLVLIVTATVLFCARQLRLMRAAQRRLDRLRRQPTGPFVDLASLHLPACPRCRDGIVEDDWCMRCNWKDPASAPTQAFVMDLRGHHPADRLLDLMRAMESTSVVVDGQGEVIEVPVLHEHTHEERLAGSKNP